jgi:membrane peptidoglycan carboxypeptidase
MGSPVAKVPMRNVAGVRVTGGSFPARIWARYMGEVLANRPAVDFPDPDPKLIPKGKYRSLKGDTSARRTRSRTTTTVASGPAPTVTAEPTPTSAPETPPPTEPEPPPATSPPTTAAPGPGKGKD